MKIQFKILAPCLVTLGVAGCAAPGGPSETGGMVVGGVLGGALGSQVGGGHGRTAATVIGALIGANIGANVGRSMDATDRARTAQVFETTTTGQSTRWVNPDTGNQFVVTPTRTYEASGAPCREYIIKAVVGGRPDDVYGTACRQPDGSWKIVN